VGRGWWFGFHCDILGFLRECVCVVDFGGFLGVFFTGRFPASRGRGKFLILVGQTREHEIDVLDGGCGSRRRNCCLER
jgi:hypothetical protein